MKTPEPISDNHELFSNIAANLNRSHEHMKGMLAEVAGIHGLQKSDYDVLSALHNAGKPRSLSPKALSKLMMFSSGGLTKVLNRLDAAGVIHREESAEDKRGKPVKLTALGLHVTERLSQQLVVLEQQAFAVLTQNQRQQLDKLLTRLLASWEKE